MKTLYIECAMGAAGDMLAAALLELLPDRAAFLAKMNGLGIPGVTVSGEKSVKCGVAGTHFSVKVAGIEEDENLHSHHHDHVHGSMEGIEEIVNRLPIPSMVKLDILAVYNLIAEAESRVHGVPVQQIHFHEVGAMDAVADITAVCLLMREIRPDQVIVSPVSVGSGTVRCAHGILPVPAPATALLLEGMPIHAGNVQGELCTPTGAALLKYFADDFGSLPVMRVQKTGYGMGKKDFPQANCLRVMLGETSEQTDAIAELKCNIDDMTGEEIGFAMEQLLSGGALDVFTTPIGMKKNRPGVLLSVLAHGDSFHPLRRGSAEAVLRLRRSAAKGRIRGYRIHRPGTGTEHRPGSGDAEIGLNSTKPTGMPRGFCVISGGQIRRPRKSASGTHPGFCRLLRTASPARRRAECSFRRSGR